MGYKLDIVRSGNSDRSKHAVALFEEGYLAFVDLHMSFPLGSRVPLRFEVEFGPFNTEVDVVARDLFHHPV